jgi:hypothetical protein
MREGQKGQRKVRGKRVVYIWKIPYPPEVGGGGISQCHFGGKKKRKRGKCEEKMEKKLTVKR